MSVGYIANKLDEVDIDRVMDSLQRAFVERLVGLSPAEVAYRNQVESLDVTEMLERRRSDYDAYDHFCDGLLSTLEQTETTSASETINLLANPLKLLIQLDGQRRAWSWKYNDPTSTSRRTEQRLANLVEKVVGRSSDAEILTREILVNILAPSLPFDVQMTHDFLKVICLLDLRWEDLNGEQLSRLVSQSSDQLQSYLMRYARGSVVTFVRRLARYNADSSQAAVFLKRIAANAQESIDRKAAALEEVTQRINGNNEEACFAELLGLTETMAHNRNVDDQRRRVCMDRFEDYLVRSKIATALSSLGLLSSGDFLKHSEADLIRAVDSYLGNKG